MKYFALAGLITSISAFAIVPKMTKIETDLGSLISYNGSIGGVYGVTVYEGTEENAHVLCIRAGYNRASEYFVKDVNSLRDAEGKSVRVIAKVSLKYEGVGEDVAYGMNKNYLSKVSCAKDL